MQTLRCPHAGRSHGDLMFPVTSSLRGARALAAAVLLVVLTGCGGGWDLGGGFGNGSDPQVSLAASVSTAAVGDVVHLVAAAVDDSKVDSVEFFSIVNGNTV